MMPKSWAEHSRAYSLLLVLLNAACGGCAVFRPPEPDILAHRFETDPATAGWELRNFPGIAKPAKGGWVHGGSRTPEGPAEEGHLSVEKGYWQGPSFAVTPHRYYRLTFRSRAQIPGYWAAMFYDSDGNVLEADHNSGIFQTDDWIDNEVYFQGKADAVSARLWFFPVSPRTGRTIDIGRVRLAKATDRQVLEWADRLYATLPPVRCRPPRDRWARIPRAMRKLRNGEPLRIVILGDSIGNDTGNAPLDKLIQRNYPGSRVTVITSVRGGTGCGYYQEEGRVEHYVTRYRPDLVMIIAISHAHQMEPIRKVIRQIRAQADAEIILTTAPIFWESVMTSDYAVVKGVLLKAAKAGRRAFLDGMRELAEDERVEFIPLRDYWNEHLAAAAPEHDVAWFMRDGTHANVRGAQTVARMLEKYFAPDRD